MSEPVPLPADVWQSLPPQAQAFIRALQGQVQQLQQRVADLEARLGQNSTNSSRPPSADAPAVQRRPPPSPSGRRRGAQPGQEPPTLTWLTPTRVEPLKPTACRRCGRALAGEDEQPLRHQVIDLPEIRPTVTEYQLHRLSCPCCGTSTCAPLPPGVPTGRHGPRLQAALALCTGAYRLSKRMVEALCADLLNVPLSLGSICRLEQETAAATEPVVRELRAEIKKQSANMDETSWRQQGRRAWLWVAVAACVTVFHIARSRSGAVARQLLGPGFHWVLTSDRFSAYNWLALRYRQVCWAHLKRDFQAMVDRRQGGAAIGEELLCCAQDVFTWWYRVRDGTLQRSTFRQYISQLRSSFRQTLEEGRACACAQTAGTCRELLRLEPALWTFVRVEGIEPTNNAAERALRHAVLWRKSSYGTDSAAGSRFVANILSVVATCRQQERNVLDFLTRCCQAHLQGQAAPSLLPQALAA
jgi:transposase